eukprot:CAMPEP_0171471528 /NCGR_PEP_ID=MMETSP0946-20130122/757_1 /TAXON_ID=109269 /ORGANISM="Vaucheria litorea, Strain CCMP2940" /LENGTH=119 /DNA_ID=CAMNT_0012001033 /DNA_START=494 /DNA_END=853 /DNA_ORIENTATION=+
MPLADANLQQWQNCLNDVISPDEIEIIDYRCTSEFEDNASAAAAGFVIITICNLLWVVWAGSLKEPPPQQLKRESPNSVNTNGSTKKATMPSQRLGTQWDPSDASPLYQPVQGLRIPTP